MSAAAVVAEAAPKGKKKLLLIAIIAVVLLVAVGGALAVMMKKKAADAEEGEDAGPAAAHASAERDPKAVPTFVPLDPFTVNLADHDVERYAQVGMTLEVADPKVAEEIKAYMPAIRNNVLMALAEKTAAQLKDREGKAALAEQIRRETSRAMGYPVEPAPAKAADGDEEHPAKHKRRAKVELPIKSVQFSNFIIQ